jgi:hypothetical protein
MPIPLKHHFLPRWYLARWENDGSLREFRRHGPKGELKGLRRSAAATGYRVGLYTMPGEPLENAASIETDFLQIIDDRGARAVRMAEEELIIAGPADKVGLMQFVISMIHRSPERIDYLHGRLESDLSKLPLFEGEGPDTYRRGALGVFSELVQSSRMIDRLMHYSTFVMKLGDGAHKLLTSDSPIMMSHGLFEPDSFIVMPLSPDRILILSDDRKIPEYLARQRPKQLSGAINDAVTAQAKEIVIATDERQRRFIENRLGRNTAPLDPISGLVRWQIR